MKPVVHYSGKAWFEGGRAYCHPIDHPNHIPGQRVSNTRTVITSLVIRRNDEIGEFETENTIYRRADNNNKKEPNNAVSQLQRDSE